MRSAWMIVGLVGCGGLSENDFIGQYEELFCESYTICASEEMLRTVNERKCLEYLRYEPYPVGRPECRYNSEAAEACLESFTRAGCVGNNPEFPQGCLDVWSLCAYPRVVPAEPPTTAPPA